MKNRFLILAAMAACMSFAGCEGTIPDDKKDDIEDPIKDTVISDEIKDAIESINADLARMEIIDDDIRSEAIYKDKKNYTITLYDLSTNKELRKDTRTDNGKTRVSKFYTPSAAGDLYLCTNEVIEYTTNSTGKEKPLKVTTSYYDEAGSVINKECREYVYDGDRVTDVILNDSDIIEHYDYMNDYNYTVSFYEGWRTTRWYEYKGDAATMEILAYRREANGSTDLEYKSVINFTDSSRERVKEEKYYELYNGEITLMRQSLYSYDSENELIRIEVKSDFYGNTTTYYLPYKGFNVKTVETDATGRISASSDTVYDPTDRCLVTTTTGDYNMVEKYYLR